MTSTHEGVSCDSCRKNNFRGLRYTCLVCYDYDLCSGCYEAGLTSSRHLTSHPMQCIVAKNDYDLFYSGETTATDQHQSLTCPLCGILGFTETSLLEHVTSDHSTSENEETSAGVVCPICGVETNQLTYDFATHLTMEHRTPRDSTEQVAIRGGRGARSHARTNGLRVRRSQLQYNAFGSTSSGAGAGHTNSSPASIRDPTDPLVEIIAQLSGVRRAGSSTNSNSQSPASQLHQLQMQLQSSPSFPGRNANDREIRLMRRTFQAMSSQMNSSTSTTSTLCGPGPPPPPLPAGTVPTTFCTSARPLASVDQRSIHSMGLSGNGPSSSAVNGMTTASASFGNLCNGIYPASSVLSNQSSSETQSASTSQYLLSRCLNPTPTEAELQQREILKADRSLFVQDLLLQVGSIEKNK